VYLKVKIFRPAFALAASCIIRIADVRYWPKQTCLKTQSMSLLGVKRTSVFAVRTSAFDPKRTSMLDE
jgi:hypothetical protein